jgi:hypothetical protein
MRAAELTFDAGLSGNWYDLGQLSRSWPSDLVLLLVPPAGFLVVVSPRSKSGF